MVTPARGKRPITPPANLPTNHSTTVGLGPLDSRLARSFWGVDYTPHGTQLQFKCGVTQEEVIEDLRLLYQITPRIRLYGMDCNQADYVMNGMRILNIDMGVILTIWVDNNQTTYQRQYNNFWRVLETYGGDNIIGVSVGNEALFRKEVSVSTLVAAIRDVKQKMISLGYPDIPVYTTDIRELPKIMPEQDAVLDNVHPFFAGTLAQDAANWTYHYFYGVDQYPTIKLAEKLGQNKTKPAMISEIGWPTFPEDGSIQAAVPSIENQQILLDTFICQANRRGLPYFWFEFKDEPWKQAMFNETRESFWGIFDKDNNLKVPSLPNCTLPLWKKGDLYIPQPKPLDN
ncbi:glycoside hydrolase superfamily [Phycomyces nitens]|nr:glycoside hydrolase superfamily [Phycomyces nitens]